YKKHLSFFPSVFWIYFLPMLCSSLGLLDSKSPIFSLITNHFLPASLILLLMCVDIKAIIHLGRTALGMFLIGSLGIMAGTVLVFALFKGIVGPQFWGGFGALSGSWTGGSANMIAVKEALSTPNDVFLPMVVVDTVVPYTWMAFLILMVGWEKVFDPWNRARTDLLTEFNKKVNFVPLKSFSGWQGKQVLLILIIGMMGSALAGFLGKGLPEIQGVVSVYAWVIIIASFLGIGLSFTRCRNLESYGASRIGTWILYFVLTSIGAKASLANLGSACVLILAGFCIVLVHAVFMLVGARLLRAPLFLVAIASQANIGGVASAPMVAACYQPSLAPVGLLLAVLGNIIGTYCGIVTGQLCHWII
ncbi:MAG: DUF819 family protein, partial [Candidatus Omnitrophica bacterium]|nr:DUF819 family protein [Candidatus Omnitrophota bacterium]